MQTIIEILIWVLLAYLLCLVVWTFYLATMKLMRAQREETLTRFAKYNAYIIVATGLLPYLLLNIVVGTILFLDLPREFEFTKRCRRYIKSGKGWRYVTAKWICKNLLDPFDEGGHC